MAMMHPEQFFTHWELGKTPEFIEEQDGWYTHRLVLDEPITAGPMPEGQTVPPQPLAHHEEKLDRPIPRMCQRLVWR